MWSLCRQGEGAYKDPFGWDGPEVDRPWVWGVLIAARRQMDYQDQQISWHCKLIPENGAWKHPCYPPTDHTRSYPRLFSEWTKMMEIRQKQYKDDHENVNVGTWRTDDHELVRDMYSAIHAHCTEGNRMAYIFFDMDTGLETAVDYWGNAAHN